MNALRGTGSGHCKMLGGYNAAAPLVILICLKWIAVADTITMLDAIIIFSAEESE